MRAKLSRGIAGLLALAVLVAPAVSVSAQGAAGTVLGTVKLPKAVKANGEALPAGTYTVRLTNDSPKPAVGLTSDAEKWVEFVQGGKVVGREVASIIPADEVKDTQQGPDLPGKQPKAGTRVDTLKGGDYVRVWITRQGVQYLIHMPPA